MHGETDMGTGRLHARAGWASRRAAIPGAGSIRRLSRILALPKREGWLLTIGVEGCPVVLLASEDGRCRESYDAQQTKRHQGREDLQMSETASGWGAAESPMMPSRHSHTMDVRICTCQEHELFGNGDGDSLVQCSS